MLFVAEYFPDTPGIKTELIVRNDFSAFKMTPKSSKALLIDRPSVKVLSLSEFSKEELQLYNMIYTKTLASVMEDALVESLSISISASLGSSSDYHKDKDNRDKIIDQLNKKNVSSLEAFYICVLVGVRSDLDPIPLYSVGEIHGRVSTKSSGDGGFGYDKIFYPNGYDVSMASIDPEEKNKISHRAVAARSFIKELEKL